MKPAPFEYQAPATLREAIDLLVSDPEATVIAGGQSLMPFVTIRGQLERCAHAAPHAKPGTASSASRRRRRSGAFAPRAALRRARPLSPPPPPRGASPPRGRLPAGG